MLLLGRAVLWGDWLWHCCLPSPPDEDAELCPHVPPFPCCVGHPGHSRDSDTFVVLMAPKLPHLPHHLKVTKLGEQDHPGVLVGAGPALVSYPWKVYICPKQSASRTFIKHCFTSFWDSQDRLETPRAALRCWHLLLRSSMFQKVSVLTHKFLKLFEASGCSEMSILLPFSWLALPLWLGWCLTNHFGHSGVDEAWDITTKSDTSGESCARSPDFLFLKAAWINSNQTLFYLQEAKAKSKTTIASTISKIAGFHSCN